MNYVNLQDTRVNLDMVSAYEATSRDNRGREGWYIRFITPSSYSFYVGFSSEQSRNESLERLDRITSPAKGL